MIEVLLLWKDFADLIIPHGARGLQGQTFTRSHVLRGFHPTCDMDRNQDTASDVMDAPTSLSFDGDTAILAPMKSPVSS